MQDQLIKDICTQNCLERTNPYYRCKLAGSGSVIKFFQIQKLGSFDPSILTQIQAALGQTNCPTRILANAIKDNQPLIQVKFDNNKTYYYPQERCAEVPTIGKIISKIDEDVDKDPSIHKNEKLETKKRKKLEIMKKIQPNPKNRFVMTNEWIQEIEEINLENIPIISTHEHQNLVVENNLKNIKITSKKSRSFKTGKIALENGIYKRCSSKKIYYYSETDQNITQEILDKLKTYLKNLSLDFELTYLKSLDMLEDIEKNSTVLHILENEDSHINFNDLLVKSIENKVFHEKITISSFSKILNAQKDYFYNVILGFNLQNRRCTMDIRPPK
jgi:hypothetical protein